MEAEKAAVNQYPAVETLAAQTNLAHAMVPQEAQSIKTVNAAVTSRAATSQTTRIQDTAVKPVVRLVLIQLNHVRHVQTMAVPIALALVVQVKAVQVLAKIVAKRVRTLTPMAQRKTPVAQITVRVVQEIHRINAHAERTRLAI